MARDLLPGGMVPTGAHGGGHGGGGHGGVRRLTLAATVTEPVVSGDLAHAMDRVLAPHPNVDWRGGVSVRLRAEARRYAGEYAHLCRPVSLETIRTFLLSLQFAVANPLNEADFHSRAVAVHLACADVPEAVFTSARQAEALGRFVHFPTPAEVLALVVDDARRLRARRRAIETLAAAEDPHPAKVSLTDAEREAVLASFRPRYAAAVGEVRAVAEASGTRPKAKARYLSRAQLAAAWRDAAETGDRVLAAGRNARAESLEDPDDAQ